MKSHHLRIDKECHAFKSFADGNMGFLFFNLLFNLTMAVYAKMRNAVQDKFTYCESQIERIG